MTGWWQTAKREMREGVRDCAWQFRFAFWTLPVLAVTALVFYFWPVPYQPRIGSIAWHALCALPVLIALYLAKPWKR